MKLSVPALSSPMTEPKSGVMTPAWAHFISTMAESATTVAASTAAVSVAPVSYSQAWGQEVVAALAEIQQQQAAIIAALQGAGKME